MPPELIIRPRPPPLPPTPSLSTKAMRAAAFAVGDTLFYSGCSSMTARGAETQLLLGLAKRGPASSAILKARMPFRYYDGPNMLYRNRHQKVPSTTPIPLAAGEPPFVSSSCLSPGSQRQCRGEFSYIAGVETRSTGVATLGDIGKCVIAWPNASKDSAGLPAQLRQRQLLIESKTGWRSESDEDLIIWANFFSDRPTGRGSGTYLEIGALDGLTSSNSRFFESCLGWRGVLIEPDPQSFFKLAAPDNRPTADKLHFVPSCQELTTMTLASSGDVYSKVIATEGSAPNRNHKRVEVHCGPLGVYLHHIGHTHIDFFSLDVEGAELAVLQTAGIARGEVSFHVVIAEAWSRSGNCMWDCPVRDQVREFMAAAGFNLYQGLIARSDVFVNKSMPQPRFWDDAPPPTKVKSAHRIFESSRVVRHLANESQVRKIVAGTFALAGK
jgi:FkbM family methyltransferase